MTNQKFHNRVLTLFGEQYYGEILSKVHLIEELVIEDYPPLWYATRNNKKYLIDRDMIPKLPIKVIATEEITYRNKVYYRIVEYQTVTFKQEKNHSFRDFVDGFANFKHSNPKHFTLYKIVALATHLDRMNFRIATNAGFGKDSVWECLHLLKRDVSVINPRSMPALEYRLFNKVLVLNELSNLESSQRDLVQEFLLLCGDMRTSYEKSTRASSKTFDYYNIQNLSLVCMFNDYKYYQDVGREKKFFDNVFTKAVHDRFIPFKMEGRIDTDQFHLNEPIGETLKRHWLDYIRLLRSLEYYRHNWRKHVNPYKIEDLGKLGLSQRHKHTFEKITMFVSMYAKSLDEFKELINELYECNKAYRKMMTENKYTLAKEYIEGSTLEVGEEEVK